VLAPAKIQLIFQVIPPNWPFFRQTRYRFRMSRVVARRYPQTILPRPGFVLVGVMGYEGQIAGCGTPRPANSPGRLTEYHLIHVDTDTPSVPTYRGGGQCLDEAIAAGPQTSVSLPPAPINIAYSPPLVSGSARRRGSTRADEQLPSALRARRPVTVIAGITVTHARSVP